jgi:hypothetical protein
MFRLTRESKSGCSPGRVESLSTIGLAGAILCGLATGTVSAGNGVCFLPENQCDVGNVIPGETPCTPVIPIEESASPDDTKGYPEAPLTCGLSYTTIAGWRIWGSPCGTITPLGCKCNKTLTPEGCK